MQGLKIAFAAIALGIAATAAVAGSGDDAQCRQLVLSGEVKDYRSFFREIGMGLRFRIEPEQDFGGWRYNIGPTQPLPGEWDTYVGITPPYHFGDASRIGTGWGKLAQEAAGPGARRFWFLASREQAARADLSLEKVIRSLDTARREAAMNELDAFWIGQGELEILRSQIRPGQPNARELPIDEADFGEVLGVAFRLTLVVPAGFRPVSGLEKARVDCPKPGAWHEL